MGYVRSRKRNGGTRYTAYYIDPSGRERSAGTFDNPDDAEKEWKRQEGRILDDRWIDGAPGRMKLGKFIDTVYWPEYARNREASTRAGYYYAIKNYIKPTFEDVALAAITHEAVQSWANKLLDRKLSPATVRKAVALLRKILNVAIKTGRLATSNPAVGVELPTVLEPKIKVITPEQFDVLYAEMPEQHQMIVEIAIESGFRWGELVALRRSDFDPKTRLLSANRAVAEVSPKSTQGFSDKPKEGEETRFVEKEYPKDEEPRRVQISKEVSVRLAEHFLKLGLQENDLMFPATNGGYLSRYFFRTKAFLDARRKANLEAATMRGMRHAHASWLLQAGRTLAEVKERLGHSLITTTQKYIHTVDIEQDEVVDAFTAFRNRGKKAS